MTLNHRFHKRRCLRERFGKHFLVAKACVGSGHRGFQSAGVPYTGGPTVAGDGCGVYEDEILDGYGSLLPQRYAS
jgi:hypothetical protein